MIKRNKLPFQNIINSLAGKRFSKPELAIIALLAMFLVFLAQKWLTGYISDIKNQPGVIVTTIPPTSSLNPDENLPQSVTSEPAAASQKTKTEIRDPFLPSINAMVKLPTDEKKPIADLKISGILWDQKVPTAIINSTVVKIGDIVAGKTIVDMEKDRIILMENGEIFVLELRQKSQ